MMLNSLLLMKLTSVKFMKNIGDKLIEQIISFVKSEMIYFCM